METNYVYMNNAIHKTNPIVKLSLIFGFLVMSFMFNSPFYLVAFFINMVMLSLFAQSFLNCMKFLKYIGIIGFFTILFNVLINKRGNTVYIIPIIIFKSQILFKISIETVIYSIITVMQIGLAMFVFALMNNIINPDELMQSFTKLKAPFVLTIIMTLSIRFFPLLTEDLKIITEVQKTRGYEVERGNWLKRVKNRMYLLLPLLTNSLERAIQVSEAMEARAFGISNRRIYFRDIALTKLDYFAIFFNFIIIVTILMFGSQGFGVYEVYPQISIPKVSFADLLIMSFLTFGNLIMIILMNLRRIKN